MQEVFDLFLVAPQFQTGMKKWYFQGSSFLLNVKRNFIPLSYPKMPHVSSRKGGPQAVIFSPLLKVFRHKLDKHTSGKSLVGGFNTKQKLG